MTETNKQTPNQVLSISNLFQTEWKEMDDIALSWRAKAP